MPLGKQGRAKARKRSVPIEGHGAEKDAEPGWRCPPLDECVKVSPFLVPLEDQPLDRHRVVVQLYESVETGEMVRFALIQQVHASGGWRDVVEVDNAHDVDVHLHQYCRSTFGRNRNDPEVICAVAGTGDVANGYNLAYERVFEMWQENLQRWTHG